MKTAAAGRRRADRRQGEGFPQLVEFDRPPVRQARASGHARWSCRRRKAAQERRSPAKLPPG